MISYNIIIEMAGKCNDINDIIDNQTIIINGII